jgi:hypothetical protein
VHIVYAINSKKIRVVLQVFVPPGDRSEVPNVMIFITWDKDDTDVVTQHQLALSKNITTYALGFGTASNQPDSPGGIVF